MRLPPWGFAYVVRHHTLSSLSWGNAVLFIASILGDWPSPSSLDCIQWCLQWFFSVCIFIKYMRSSIVVLYFSCAQQSFGDVMFLSVKCVRISDIGRGKEMNPRSSKPRCISIDCMHIHVVFIHQYSAYIHKLLSGYLVHALVLPRLLSVDSWHMLEHLVTWLLNNRCGLVLFAAE